MRQAERDRQRRRLLEGEAEAKNAAGGHVGDDREICPADERSAAVDDLDEVDVGGRVIDLADIERRRRMDVSRPRFEPLEMLRIGGPFPRDLLGAEQPGIRPATVR